MKSIWIGGIALAFAAVAADAPSGQQLCGRLAAEQLGKLLGSPRAAEAGETQCKYTGAGRPEVRLFNSKAATPAAFIKAIHGLGGKTQDGPAGAVFSSIGFDLKKGRISGLWTLSKKAPVELDFDGGVTPAEAGSIAQALAE